MTIQDKGSNMPTTEYPLYYVCTANYEGSITRNVWVLEKDNAFRFNLELAKYVQYPHSTPINIQNIFDAISSTYKFKNTIPKCSFHLVKLKAGQYYPRMARPTNFDIDSSKNYNPEIEIKKDLISIGLNQLNILTRQLSEICQTIHPDEPTFDTYGHSIRNLLILACTEVESHWRGVLSENKYSPKHKNFTTEDYFILRDAMKLNEYKVNYIKFPWLQSISPFENWSEPNTTSSLNWYAAYNAVKHDRENEFHQATLRHAFEAITACAIMMKAQFGEKFDEWKFSEAERFFSFTKYPNWPENEIYLDPFTPACGKKISELWSAVPHKN